MILFIEFTSHCNMHCTFCPSDHLKRKKEHIDDALLQRFLHQVHELPERPPILCNVLGEPLLNKKIYQYLDLFEKHGHEVTLITNTIPLQDENVRKELLKHNNLTLALSIQTVTKQSYKMRGCTTATLKEMLNIPFQVIEEKFKQAGSTRIEIHIASNYALLNDPTIAMDSPLNIWGNFPTRKAEEKWTRKYIKKLEAFAKKIKKKYPGPFAAEQDYTRQKYKEHIGTKIAVSRETLPQNFRDLTEETFWGYMFMPNVFLRFKPFALWNREYTFLRSVIQDDKFIYSEEKCEPQPCAMTDNLGILSNGDLVLCCLDYEGEMNLGNIKDTNIKELLQSDRLARIRENAMCEAVCRRCKGNTFILDTAKLAGKSQRVDKFGRGWEGYEEGMYGLGGRWTRGTANAYVYARIAAGKISIKFRSEQDSEIAFNMEIHSYDKETGTFKKEEAFIFYGRKGEVVEVEFPFAFTLFTFYKILLKGKTFVPDEECGNGDKRSLGIAVFEMEIKKA
ncbi:MAG: SPASM domain-containing protein [Candidatus Aminicenantes bacterium]|nr:SPASM domain-containing protein [Candidatus Aminicenantes bacterium]